MQMKKNVTFKVEQKWFSISLLKPWKEQNEVKPQSGRYKTKRMIYLQGHTL